MWPFFDILKHIFLYIYIYTIYLDRVSDEFKRLLKCCHINTCKKSALAFTLIHIDLAIFWREKISVRRDFNNYHCSRKIGEVAKI